MLIHQLLIKSLYCLLRKRKYQYIFNILFYKRPMKNIRTGVSIVWAARPWPWYLQYYICHLWNWTSNSFLVTYVDNVDSGGDGRHLLHFVHSRLSFDKEATWTIEALFKMWTLVIPMITMILGFLVSEFQQIFQLDLTYYKQGLYNLTLHEFIIQRSMFFWLYTLYALESLKIPNKIHLCIFELNLLRYSLPNFRFDDLEYKESNLVLSSILGLTIWNLL